MSTESKSPSDRTRADGSRSQRSAILAVLLLVAAAAWAALAWPRPVPMAMTGSMGLWLGPFLLIWVVMMVAMMFPTAAPMILTFHKIQSRRSGSRTIVNVWVFVAGYLLLWSLTGALAYGLARLGEAAAGSLALSSDACARLGGAVLIAAGLYQLTPLKALCLSHCRTPVAFIMTAWRPGTAGAFAMGWSHGLYCFGCCWLLFAILFPLGMMNIAAMAAITVLIFIEKTLASGPWCARAAAAALIIFGAIVIARPGLLPQSASSQATKMDMKMDMDMPMSGPASP